MSFRRNVFGVGRYGEIRGKYLFLVPSAKIGEQLYILANYTTGAF